jgi:hypothetical protein
VSSVEISRANPLDHAGEIKHLFVTHDHPEFPEFFDRAYPSAVRSGASSWIGVDTDRRLVMHIGQFPHRFALGEQTVIAGLLVNLLVAKAHRTFLPALSLLRRMAKESQAEAALDFLYGDPSTAAQAVFKSAGFSTVGMLDRFVLPLAGRRWYTDAAVRIYGMTVALGAHSRRFATVRQEASSFNADAFERPLGHAPALRPFRPRALYHGRLPGYPGRTDYWFTVQSRGRSTSVRAAVFVRGEADGTARLLTVARPPDIALTAIVPGLATALRRLGYSRLWIFTLTGTRLANELSRAGFAPRHETTPLIALALTQLGVQAMESTSTWEITELDCDR